MKNQHLDKLNLELSQIRVLKNLIHCIIRTILDHLMFVKQLHDYLDLIHLLIMFSNLVYSLNNKFKVLLHFALILIKELSQFNYKQNLDRF